MDTCIICGDHVPEGRMVCPRCEAKESGQYLLISVFDREIFTERFATRDDAFHTMLSEIVECGGDIDLEYATEYCNDFVGFNVYGGFLRTKPGEPVGRYRSCDWQIVIL